MRFLRSPVTVFLVIGLITAAAILAGTNILADRAASDEAIAEAQATTKIIAQSVVGPAIPPAMADARSESADDYYGMLDEADREIQASLHYTDRPFLINVWSRDGRLIYSSKLPILLGQDQIHLNLDEDQRRVLREGGTGYERADPARPVDRAAAGTKGMVRIYATAVPSGPRGKLALENTLTKPKHVLVEAYFPSTELGARRAQIFDSFRWITVGGLVLLMMVATGLLVALTRQVRRGARERERLLQSAMDASDAERRRIARDLHDGVVQDLAGTAFSVGAVSRMPDLPEEAREPLSGAGTSLRGSLKSLRSLLAEIHPPDLRADGLAAALGDLIAPAGTVGIQASVSVHGTEGATDEQAALVWRVAQEAVRNTIRHSEASTLAVTVRGDGDRLTLEVVDDGVGFDPKVARPESFGLRGLRSLVADNGGVLEVRSAPGEGTTVRMEVGAR
ncbi:sensor histidine kinase [Nocardioides sp.]|uniref:sensor histidine kinase n=1 Tax=Nocardioides sp. TaxID=35761 RepID=UPI003784E84C